MQKYDTVKITYIIYLQIISFFAYLISLYYNQNILQETLFSVCMFISAFVIIYAYNEIKRSSHRRVSWLVIFMGYVSYIVGNILSVMYKFLGTDSYMPIPVIIAYMLTNAAFIIGIISFVFIYYKKWNRTALFLDMFVIMALSFALLGQVYLCSPAETALIFQPAVLLAAVSVLLDTIIIASEGILFSSVNKNNMPAYLRITGGGFLLYSFTDILNNYNRIKDMGISDAIMGAFYMASFIVIAAGAFFQIHKQDYEPEQDGLTDDMVIARKLLVIMLYPAAALIMSRIVYNPYLWNEMIFFFGMLGCYFGALLCVRNYMKSQRLLEKEKELRSNLENVVYRQIGELTRLANEDIITKLYNRQFFLERLNNEIEERKQNEYVFVMMIDIHRFKAINDIYGHHIGDMVLKQVADRIKEWNTVGATISRYGEDEFALFKREEIEREKIEDIAASLIKYVARPIDIEGNEIDINVSMGISVCPIYADKGDMLLHYADIAMYRAKTTGMKNKYVFFDPALSEYARKKNEIGFLLEKAVKENKFMIYYQPQFTLPDRKLAGAEALIRWKDEKYGFIPPSEFIPIAEELGIIKELDTWVRREAFKQAAEWNKKYGISLQVGVNVSPKELADDEFISLLEKNIAESNVDPKWTSIEITESIVLEDSEKMDRIFDFFKKTGITVSVDDFGTGYSSMNYIKKYPFSCIKIDRSLIDKISTSENDRKIVKAIIAMSRAINMKTIAEGIETKEQEKILTNMGCDQAQSFMYGEPVPPDKFEEMYL